MLASARVTHTRAAGSKASLVGMDRADSPAPQTKAMADILSRARAPAQSNLSLKIVT